MYRDHEDAKVGGVCAALGHRFGIDPVWLRIPWAVAIFVYGVGVLPYLILWWAIPNTPKRRQKALEEAAPQNPEEVPKELVEAWKEVNDLTEN
jgi:phage shock protein PspC (stress-responsive transcriptional regulator)